MKVFLGYLLQATIFIVALTAIIVCFVSDVSWLEAFKRASFLTVLGYTLLFLFFLSIDLIEGKI